jgi:hypothetical protein
MTEFERRIKLLNLLGAEWTQDYEYRGEYPNRNKHELEIFKSVKLPLQPAEWCSLFMKEGSAYVGGCCGSMSYLQDTICREIRMQSGWFDIHTLADIAEVMIEHGCGDDDEGDLNFAHLPAGESLEDFTVKFVEEMRVHDLAPPSQRRPDLDPWEVMALIWHITKGFYSPKIPGSYGPHMSEIEKATNIIHNSCRAISWERLFNVHPNISQEKANRSMLLYRMIPALKLLNDNIDKLNIGSIDGWALVDKSGEICTNVYGYCVYDDRKKLEEVLNLWKRDDEQHQDKKMNPPIMERIDIKRVRISAEKGIEFL